MWYIQQELDRDIIDLSEYHQPVIDPLNFTITLTISPDGNLKHIAPLNSTGITELDNHLMHKIRKVAPFPPLPERLQHSDLTLHLTVVCVPKNYKGKITLL